MVTILGSTNANADNNNEITFASDPWPPYFMHNQLSHVNSGVGYDLVNELFTLIPDTKASFPKLPWKRALLEVEQGTKDGIALLLKNAKREQYMEFTAPLIQSPAFIYFNRNRFPNGFEWNDTNDFKGLRIGIVRGFSYGEPLDSYILNKTDNIFEVTTSKQLFSMLARQHIDLVPENASVANKIVADQNWLESLGYAEKILSTDILHIGISKKSKFVSLIPQLNKAIESLRLSGRIDQIVGVNGSSVSP